MSNFADLDADMTGAIFAQLADDAVLVTPDLVTINTRAIVFDDTRVVGEFGITGDARTSVELPIADVGTYPQGTLTVAGRVLILDRPVDSKTSIRYTEGLGNNRAVIMWADPA